MKTFLSILMVLTLAVSLIGQVAGSPVYVTLWFDTEDYILPASDDDARSVWRDAHAAGRRATFKVVGEKARRLERPRTRDVIDALKKHEIGYHSNTHSTQPTSPCTVEPRLGRWASPSSTDARRRRPGHDAYLRVHAGGLRPAGQLVGAAVYRALQKWGIPMYLDDSITSASTTSRFTTAAC